MLYAIIGSVGLAGIFLFLWVRSAITNGILRNQIAELTKNDNVQDKQLEIAASPALTDDELADKLRKGNL